MSDNPFRECLGKALGDIYRDLDDIYPGAVDSKDCTFLWAMQNRRPLYDDLMAALATMDDLWERTDTDTFKGALESVKEAIRAIYDAYAAETSNTTEEGATAAHSGQQRAG